MTSAAMARLLLALAALLAALLACVAHAQALNCAISHRNDCGYEGITAQQCSDKGCCWQPNAPSGQPWCFYSVTTPPRYTVSAFSSNGAGFTASLSLSNPGAGSFGPAIPELTLTAVYETAQRAHFRLTDASRARYEIPQSVLPYPQQGTKDFPHFGEEGSYAQNPAFTVSMPQVGQTFGLTVTRTSDNVVLFNLADLEYSDQYLQMSSLLADSGAPLMYGVGEHIIQFQLPTNTHSYTMWNVDEPTPFDQNAYGAHPFYLQLLAESGHAHGVFVRSSNGMDVVLTTSKITFKIIGGILEWYVFTGTQPEQVIQQYHAVIGRPHLPPYWSLGWHQCKYGWKNLQEVETVVANYASNEIPLDTIWGDIDYMDAFEDFSWDPVNYPVNQVKQFAAQLHQAGQQYVVIVDPGIHNRSGYEPYESGLAQNLFITEGDGKTPFIGTVWPGTTAFPDFLNPATSKWWSGLIADFLSGVPYDGLWIDMNELSNFHPGQPFDPNAPVNNPPYAINNFNNRAPLNTKTLPMDALHAQGTLREYDVHNLYGLTEAIATKPALQAIQGKRSFTLSRSTFPGSGAHTAHWLGDNHATWEDLYRSIPGILNSNMYGIPMVGSDICGFLGTTTEELCDRWSALGAFYPFARNHHEPAASQEPYLWPSVMGVAKKTLAMRYSLLPTLYTLFNYAHTYGGTVARSLMFNYPQDAQTYPIDRQFMWGSALLITPVLEQGAEGVTGYFPPSNRWFNAWNLTEQESTGWVDLPCSIADAIQLHVAGGSILPTQAPMLTTAATRLNPFELLVAPDRGGKALGQLFWDSGADLVDGANSLLVDFAYAQGAGALTWAVVSNTFAGVLPPLSKVALGGFAGSPASVRVNGAPLAADAWAFDPQGKVLTIAPFSAALTQSGNITWAMTADDAEAAPDSMFERLATE